MSFYTQFAEYYETIFPFSETVYAFLRRYISPGSRCLDVGCGTGHYAGKLAEEGFHATGIDLDAAMIAHAKTHYPQAIFRTMNMLDIAPHSPTPYSLLPTPFDAIFCIGNTAAHLAQAQFMTFLAAVRQTLTPGGTWVLQVMNWDYVLTQPSLAFPVITAENGVTFYREYRDVAEHQVTFHTRLEAGGTTVFEDAVILYPLHSAQIIEAHTQIGFTCIGHFANYGRSPFDPHTFSANIFVFEKAEKPSPSQT